MNDPEVHDLDGATTINLADTPQDVVPIDEIKRRLNVDREESITRFSNMTLIGMGGVSEVFSVREPVLNRDVALKVLRPASRNQLQLVEGFVREARATAQIDHPNIVPVHEMGVFDDAGVYFTMKKVEGETLRSVLTKLDAGNKEYLHRYTLRRLLEIFSAAGQGVAYAHSRGILHCDLKPGNLMLGEYGEVLVMDWGLVRYRAEQDIRDDKKKIDLDGTLPESGLAADGVQERDSEAAPTLSGTPAYMAPELIAGHEPSKQTDVYALGAILYSILTWKSSPFDDGLPVQCVLGLAARGSFLAPRKRAKRLHIPRELEAICLKAMARNPLDRYENAPDLLKDIRNFLDNYPVSAYRPNPFYWLTKLFKRRPFIPISTIVALVTAVAIFGFLNLEREAKSKSALEFAQDNILQGNSFYYQAYGTLRNWQRALEAGDTVALNGYEKQLAWQQAEFENYYEAATEMLARVEGAKFNSDLVNQMVQIFERRLEFAIASGRYDDSRRLVENLNKARYGELGPYLQKNRRLQEQMELIQSNDGILRLTTTPEGATISYLTMESNGNLQESKEEGVTPLAVRLKAGEYLLRLEALDRPPIYYPIRLSVAENLSVNLRIPQSIPEGMAYIPEGRMEVSLARRAIRTQMKLPGFFIKIGEVTMEEYLEFWKTLTTPAEQERFMAYWQLAPGKQVACWDAAGELLAPFTPDDPVVGITGEAAQAYCRYLSTKLAMTCRLPTEYEWQKAAYGIDDRSYLWGDQYIPGAALLNDTVPTRHKPEIAGTFPLDRSLYGVVDLAGNVREMVRSANDSGAIFITKGGSFLTGAAFCRRDYFGSIGGAANDVGFRYVIELPLEND